MSRSTAAFVGIGHSQVTRYDDVPLGRLAVDACQAAVEDAGLSLADIDGVICAPSRPFESEHGGYLGRDMVDVGYILRALDLNVRWGLNVNGLMGQSIAAAAQAIDSGACNYVLVFRGLHNPRGRTYGFRADEGARGREQFRTPYGIFPPAVFGGMWNAYRHKYGTGTREQMASYVVQARSNGLLYEHSYWRNFKPLQITEDDYLSSKIVATPMSVLDCDLPVQGCGAFIMSRADLALDLPHRPAYLAAYSSPEQLPTFSVAEISHEISFTNEEAGSTAIAAELWRESGLSPKDVRLGNIYDGFSLITMFWLEALGFCGRGEAFEFVQDGRIALDGEFPLNPSGGSLGSGRMHGVAQIVDSIQQIRGTAGARQVPDADVVVATIGQASMGSAFLITKEQI